MTHFQKDDTLLDNNSVKTLILFLTSLIDDSLEKGVTNLINTNKNI